MATSYSIDVAAPAADAWDAPNPPTVRLSAVLGYETPGAVAPVYLSVVARVYDLVTSSYREETVVSRSAPAAGYPDVPAWGSNWSGSYELTSPDSTFNAEDLDDPRFYRGAVLRLVRNDPVVPGTPMCLVITVVGIPKVYYFWFGVGPRESWDLPRTGEAVVFDALRPAAVLAEYVRQFTVGARRELTSGLSVSSPSGVMVENRQRSRTILSSGLARGKRGEPPVFDTGWV